jgi:anaerobic ribonucleoside-triphosphate reductase activating protein
LNYAALKTHDVANGPGVRVSLFVSGCEHACPGCFNPEAWSFSYGEPYTPKTEERVLSALRPDYIRGLTLLGGEPLHPRNAGPLLALIKHARAKLPQKDIWCYTGYDWETELLPRAAAEESGLRELLEGLDALVDGRFVESRKNCNIRFRGSENQRILRPRESFAAGNLVLWEGN